MTAGPRKRAGLFAYVAIGDALDWPRLPGSAAREITEYLLLRAPLDEVEVRAIVDRIRTDTKKRNCSGKEIRTMAVRRLATAYLTWQSNVEPDVAVKFLLDIYLTSLPAARRPRMEQVFEAAIPHMGLDHAEAFFLRYLMSFGPISLAGKDGFNAAEIRTATGIEPLRLHAALTRARDILNEHLRGLTTEESDR
jgi:hypothetical protein